MVKRRDTLIFLSVVSLIFVFVDQFTKMLAQRNLTEGSFTVIPEVLNFTLVKNAGSFFGILQGQQTFLIVLSAAVIYLIFKFYHKIPLHNFAETMYSLILAGAFGNLVDRLMFGYVIDFIDFGFWPVFNIADTCLVVGVVGLVIYYLREEEIMRAKKKAKITVKKTKKKKVKKSLKKK